MSQHPFRHQKVMIVAMAQMDMTMENCRIQELITNTRWIMKAVPWMESTTEDLTP